MKTRTGYRSHRQAPALLKVGALPVDGRMVRANSDPQQAGGGTRPFGAEPAAGRSDEDGPLLLVVEDNFIHQAVLRQMLHQRGYRTDLAEDGVVALEKVARTRYEAVFMDCQMPRMDGFAATAGIRRGDGGTRRTPVIAVTAGLADEDRPGCLAAGMDDFIAKPVRAADLDAALGRWAPHGGHLRSSA